MIKIRLVRISLKSKTKNNPYGTPFKMALEIQNNSVIEYFEPVNYTLIDPATIKVIENFGDGCVEKAYL